MVMVIDIDMSIRVNFADFLGRGPSHLVQSLKEIRDEHASIVKQVEQLKETQSAFITDILKDLSKLQEAEAQLIAKVGGEETLNKE